MKFQETFRAHAGTRPVISFEMFPPKTDAALEKFDRVVPELVKLRPDFMTVTYGALGSTRDRTLEIAARIKREHRVETASHLTCVGSTREEIDDILGALADSGIENIVALRGDPPGDETEFRPVEGGYARAIDLVRHIREHGGFGVAVAGYPEKHLEAPDLETDLDFLTEKVAAGADVVVTQLFYDNADYFRFVESCRERGVECPIVPGILPIVSQKQILRITGMCGSRIPDDLAARLEAASGDAAAEQEVGVDQAVRQVTELLEAGVPGIHFYVLNRATHMREIFARLPESLTRRDRDD